MAEEINHKIYSLRSPESELIRYIGYTSKELKIRLRGHLSEKTKCKRINWITSLKKKNLLPIIELIEDGINKNNICKKEIHYIKLFKSFGANLVNGTSGGDGNVGITLETIMKIKLANTGKISKKKGIKTGKQNPETIAKRVAKLIGKKRIITDEWRKNMSLSRNKRPIIQYDLNFNLINEFESTNMAAIMTNSISGSICKVCSGKRKTHNGFKWAYKNG